MRTAVQGPRKGARWMSPVFWLLGLTNLGSGLWMLFAPEHWFQNLPAGVPDTGPFNQHFVRDVGAAFATIGVAFLAAAPKALTRRGVLLGATLFYSLHSLVHVADLVTGRLHANHWGMDLPGVFLPTMLLIFLALPIWWPERDLERTSR
jgi:hypothetical protein